VCVNSECFATIIRKRVTASTDRRKQATPTQMTIRQIATPLHDTATIDNIAENIKRSFDYNIDNGNVVKK